MKIVIGNVMNPIDPIDKPTGFKLFQKYSYFFITINSIVKTNGELVMGAGIAKEFRDWLPNNVVAKEFGKKILEINGNGKELGLVFPHMFNLAGFQTKVNYKDDSSLELIKISTEQLNTYARRYPNHRFGLNFPGIGKGNLDEDDVMGIISILPDNIDVWKLR